jgi:hypothetical protein
VASCGRFAGNRTERHLADEGACDGDGVSALLSSSRLSGALYRPDHPVTARSDAGHILDVVSAQRIGTVACVRTFGAYDKYLGGGVMQAGRDYIAADHRMVQQLLSSDKGPFPGLLLAAERSPPLRRLVRSM